VQMPVCMPMVLILNLKKVCLFYLKKNQSWNFWTTLCIYYGEIKVEHPHTVTCQ
jgi:hypothetical protein